MTRTISLPRQTLSILTLLTLALVPVVPAAEERYVPIPMDRAAAAGSYDRYGSTTPQGFEEPQIGPWVTVGANLARVGILNPVVVEGQPIRIRFEISGNGAPGQVTEFTARMVFGADLAAEVRPPAGGAFSYVPIQMGEFVGTSVYTLVRNQRVRMDLDLVMDGDSLTGALFDIPGEYRLRFFLRQPVPGSTTPAPLDLGPFTVTVRKAEGDDRRALDILSRDPEVFRSIHLPVNVPENHIATIREALDAAPAAAIRPWLLLALCDRELGSRSGDVFKALELARELDRTAPMHPLAEDARMRLLHYLSALGHKEEARRRFYTEWQNPMGSQRMLLGSKLVESWVGKEGSRQAGPTWFLLETPGPDPEPPPPPRPNPLEVFAIGGEYGLFPLEE